MSLPSINAILRMLGRGRLWMSWILLRGLIFVFMIGYIGFAVLTIDADITLANVVVTIILAAGGAFVFIVSRLSELTTMDVVRISALERDLVRDPLTGLFNRRYLDAKLDEEAMSARNSGSPFSAIIVDLDHFKHINDTYGHAVGDQVIRHVSNLMASLARPTDTVTRYGGEEFVILAPDCNHDQIESFGEHIRSTIATTPVKLGDGRELEFTASLGAATFTIEETPSDFLRRADEALYTAKRSGRNRLCRSAAIPSSAAA